MASDWYRPKLGRPKEIGVETPPPTGLPTSPCFYCGERGWCRHRQPETKP